MTSKELDELIDKTARDLQDLEIGTDEYLVTQQSLHQFIELQKKAEANQIELEKIELEKVKLHWWNRFDWCKLIVAVLTGTVFIVGLVYSKHAETEGYILKFGEAAKALPKA